MTKKKVVVKKAVAPVEAVEAIETPVVLKEGETRAYEKYPPATPFRNTWNSCESLAEVAEKTGMTIKRASAYATQLRIRNIKCKKFKPGRK